MPTASSGEGVAFGYEVLTVHVFVFAFFFFFDRVFEALDDSLSGVTENARQANKNIHASCRQRCEESGCLKN